MPSLILLPSKELCRVPQLLVVLAFFKYLHDTLLRPFLSSLALGGFLAPKEYPRHPVVMHSSLRQRFGYDRWLLKLNAEAEMDDRV